MRKSQETQHEKPVGNRVVESFFIWIDTYNQNRGRKIKGSFQFLYFKVITYQPRSQT